ncbi:MAG: hypothetical protein IJT77_15105 [Clostridia bacterium]|nr:hypothetical protein [Clostridia bacterium]
MSKPASGAGADPRIVYADIIDLPHWQSPTRPHMSLYDRAAQFGAYKAVTGFEDMVNEEARLTDDQQELGEAELDLLNRKLALITAAIADGKHPLLTFTVFIPDEHKAGGRYVDITDPVKKVDENARQVFLMSQTAVSHASRVIDFDQIIAVHGELVDFLDDI